jgi:squalene synthase HpnC
LTARASISPVVQHLNRFGPERCERLNPDEAAAYTHCLAQSHPENFHVISRLLPPHLRADFANVYAFCRWADDLADELENPCRSLALLDWWASELADCFAGSARHPVFIALAPTLRRHDLPIEPFEDLITAFRQDQYVRRYQTWEQLLGYCRLSANPVGRMVLMMCGHRDARLLSLSDHTCTALQLANHWQDVRRDVRQRDRIYIPEDVATQHGLELDELANNIRGNESRLIDSRHFSIVRGRARAVLRDLVDRTWPLFHEGRLLWGHVGPEVRPVLRLFTLGGEAVLRCIAREGYLSSERRPRLSRGARLYILGRVWLRAGWERR